MPNSSPLITIGITAYNASDTIGKAIDSALAQTWPNTEIVIVDDCSTDGTFEIVETYRSSPIPVRVFRQPVNQGVAAVRNFLLKEARGEYVVFFDDDDTSLRDRIEKQYAVLSRFSIDDLVLCHASRRQIYPDGHQRIEIAPGSDFGLPLPAGRPMFERILLGKPVPNGFGSLASCSLMMPRRVFEKIGSYDENFRRSEDMDYTLRVALEGGIFVGIAEALVLQTMTRSSEKTLSDERKYHALIYKKYERELGADKTGFALKWLDLRYKFLLGKKTLFLAKFIFLFLQYPSLTIQKIFWALPNFRFNMNMKKFHQARHV